jgi:Peptidase family M28
VPSSTELITRFYRIARTRRLETTVVPDRPREAPCDHSAPMRALETTTELAAFEQRGAGTDSERRAAGWLAARLEATGRSVRVEPFWCRPNWALAHAWHVALGLAGSLISVSSPRLGGALVLAALVFVVVDERVGFSPGRRLTPERASQNVVAVPGEAGGPQDTEHVPVHLIITANYDAGRTGLVYRDALRAPFARAAAAFGRLGQIWPGWLGWLAVALTWVLAIAILRIGGDRGTAIGVAQFVPTVALVLALSLLLELASSGYGPAASDNGSGVAVALALASALDAAPPRRATVEVVLQGAGDGFGIGLRRYLRARRRVWGAHNTVVIGVAACGAGRPRWWTSDGQLVPLRYLPGLTRLCVDLALDESTLGATPHRGRGATPAFRARSARLPGITIGALDQRGLASRSHRADDTPEKLDQSALDATLEFGLMLVDAVDAFLRDRPSGRRNRIALRRPLPVLAGRQREPPDQLRT